MMGVGVGSVVAPVQQRQHHLTDAQVAYFVHNCSKLTAQQMAAKLGVSVSTVKRWARARGLVWKSRAWTAEELALLDREYGRKAPAEVARLVGRSEKAVLDKAHRLGLRMWEGEDLSLTDLAWVLGMHRETVKKFVASGQLGAARRKSGRVAIQGEFWRFTPDEVRAFVKKHPSAPHITPLNQRAFLRLVVGARDDGPGAA